MNVVRLIVFMFTCIFLLFPDLSYPSKHSKVDFKIIILKQNWFDLKIGYEPNPAQSILSSADISNSIFVINEENIEEYDWDLQTITLTPTASLELTKTLSNSGANSSGIEKLNRLKKSLGWGNSLERALYIHPFIVQLDNQFKYGGIFLDAPSQMAINFPVARVTVSNEKVVIALLPTHIPFVMIDPVDENGNLRQRVITNEAKKDIQQLGDSFSNWSNHLAMSEISQKFRAIIRNEQIKAIFE
jgi:hypothetical protein